MTGYGIPQVEIAAVLSISKPTLRKHFKPQIATGRARVIAKVAEALVKNALGGNLGAQCFFLKTQAGWRETVGHEHTGKDGRPIELEHVIARRTVARQLDRLRAEREASREAETAGED